MQTEAIQAALALFREPARIAEFRERPLPEDVGQIIRIAAGESAGIDEAVESTGESSETLLDASIFYLQQILFAANGDSYRALGVTKDAPQELLREHHRWLMRWLHPDRNSDGWEVVYADRVNAAWQDLKTPQRRADYDTRAPVEENHLALAVVPAPALRVRPLPVEGSRPWLTGAMVRRLPTIIFGGLAIMAMGVLGLMYWAKSTSEVKTELVQARPILLPKSNAAKPASAQEAALPVNSEVSPTPALSNAGVPDDEGLAIESAPVAADSVDEAAAAMSQLALIEIERERALNQQLVNEALAGQQRLALMLQVERDKAQRLLEEKRLVESRLAESMQQPRAIPSVPADRALAGAATRPPAPAVVAGAQSLTASEQLAARHASSHPPVRTTERVATAASLPADLVVPARVTAPATGDAQSLLSEMVAAYASGNLARFDGLFALQMTGSDGAVALRQRMQSTQMRYLEMGAVDWSLTQDSAVGRFSFRDTFVPHGEKRSVTRAGEIRMIVRVDSGKARIASLEVAGVESN